MENDPPHLENNRPQAETRLQMLKKRLQKDATLHEKHTDKHTAEKPRSKGDH